MTAPPIERTAARTPRLPSRGGRSPTVSVVIVSGEDMDDLYRALDIVRPASCPCEILVVCPCAVSEETRRHVARSGAILVPGADISSVAELRQQGAREAAGDVVLIRESRNIHDRDWLESVLQSGRRGDVEVPVPSAAERPGAHAARRRALDAATA